MFIVRIRWYGPQLIDNNISNSNCIYNHSILFQKTGWWRNIVVGTAVCIIINKINVMYYLASNTSINTAK